MTLKEASDVKTSTGRLARLARDASDAVRQAAARNPNTPLEALESLSRDENAWVRAAMAGRPDLSAAAQEALSMDADFYVRRELAGNPGTAPVLLERLSADPHFPGSSPLVRHIQVRHKVAENPNAPLSALCRLARDPSDLVREAVAANWNTPEEVLAQMEASGDGKLVAAARRRRARRPRNWTEMLSRFGPIQATGAALGEQLRQAAAAGRLFFLSSESDGYGSGDLRLEVVPGDLGRGADPPLVWGCFYLTGPGRIDNLEQLLEPGWERFSDLPGLPVAENIGPSRSFRELLADPACPSWLWRRQPGLNWQILLDQFGPLRAAVSAPLAEVEEAVGEGRLFLLSEQPQGLLLDVCASLPGRLLNGCDGTCRWAWYYLAGPGRIPRLAASLPPPWPAESSGEATLEDLLAEPRTWSWVLWRAAGHERPELRIQAVRHAQIPFALLEQLAQDADPEVRMAVAQNSKTHRQAMAMLVNDPVATIRRQASAVMAKWMLDHGHA